MGELDNLKKYLSEAHPVVNKLLRANEDASKYTFDSMFEDSEVPQPLYRLIDNEHVFIQDRVFEDKGYLSCTTDIDSFIAHVCGDEIACLQFNIQKMLLTINVRDKFPNYNDESEIILPRGLKFTIELKHVYSTHEEIQEFLERVESMSSVKEICELYRITKIYHYELSLL